MSRTKPFLIEYCVEHKLFPNKTKARSVPALELRKLVEQHEESVRKVVIVVKDEVRRPTPTTAEKIRKLETQLFQLYGQPYANKKRTDIEKQLRKLRKLPIIVAPVKDTRSLDERIAACLADLD